MEDDKPPYIVHSPTKVWLSETACAIAREQGMSVKEMAQHVLRQHQLRESGQIQREGEN
jgi:hypothetical protein